MVNPQRIAILLACAASLLAGTTWAAFENLEVSPRVRGMGSSGVAVANDAYTTYVNPAAAAELDYSTLGLSYLQPYGLNFTDLMYLGGAFPLSPKAGTIAFGMRYFSVNYQDVSLEQEFAFSLSHGIKLYEDLHSKVMFGWGLSYYQLEFGNTVGTDGLGTDGFDPGKAGAIGLDVALKIVLHERTRLGLLTHNLNTPQIGEDNEELPQRITAGIAYEAYQDVIVTFEIESQKGDPAIYHGGVELPIGAAFRLRFGVQAQPSKLAGGFSYTFRRIGVEYAYSTGGGVLDSSHQFGLQFRWGSQAP